jgi:hypothetical protein
MKDSLVLIQSQPAPKSAKKSYFAVNIIVKKFAMLAFVRPVVCL